MPSSLIQRRQEAERARLETFEASLRLVSQRTRPPPDFHTAIKEAMRGFEADVVRDPLAWKPQMKTRDAGRLRLAAARHLFVRFPVAQHLEQIWIDATGLEADEVRLRKRWFIAASGGVSLYRAGASQWLSRKEVHAFLNPLGDPGFDEALWQAIARSYAHEPGVALRIAHTRISRTPRAHIGFWRDVVRLFCSNPATVEEMDDLSDYLADCHGRNPGFSFKGRTIDSLRRQMHEWHHDLEAIARIEAMHRRAEHDARGRASAATEASATWAGAKIADWSWSPSTKATAKSEHFLVIQLKSAAELVAETRAMRHCVATYAAKCIAGHASIWSLRRRVGGTTERWLTIELDPRHRTVQIRGFANRLASADERKILERWAKARGIGLT